MVKGLRQAGCRVSVVAPRLLNGEDGICVKHPQPEANLEFVKSKTFNVKNIFRTWLLYPDADIRWCKRAAQAALEEWPEGVDWVITTSPPESIHVAGMILKKKFKCLWMADMRDFWFEYPLLYVRKNPIRKFIERPISRRLLGYSDLLTATTAEIADEGAMLSKSPAHLLENFIDNMAEANLQVFAAYPEEAIHIVHSGAFSVSDPGRKIGPVLRAFEAAHELNADIYLHLVGPLLPEEVVSVETSRCPHKIRLYGKVPYEKSRHFQMQSHALIITAAPHAKVIPGKISEYLAASRPIIAIGEGSWKVNICADSDPVKAMANLSVYKENTTPHNLMSSTDAGTKILSWMHEAAKSKSYR